jgi:hypothetical protein
LELAAMLDPAMLTSKTDLQSPDVQDSNRELLKQKCSLLIILKLAQWL